MTSEVKVFLAKVILYVIKDHTMGRSHFKYDNCDKNCVLKSKLTCRQIKHNGEKLFKTDHCNKTFDLKSKLISHLKTHIGNKPFKCEKCDKSFTSKS